MAIALKILSRRLARTRQGCASPRPTAAPPLTEPAQPPNATLYERDGWLAVSVYPPRGLTLGWTNEGGRSGEPAADRFGVLYEAVVLESLEDVLRDPQRDIQLL